MNFTKKIYFLVYILYIYKLSDLLKLFIIIWKVDWNLFHQFDAILSYQSSTCSPGTEWKCWQYPKLIWLCYGIRYGKVLSGDGRLFKCSKHSRIFTKTKTFLKAIWFSQWWTVCLVGEFFLSYFEQWKESINARPGNFSENVKYVHFMRVYK